jgi:hypothetical protein
MSPVEPNRIGRLQPLRAADPDWPRESPPAFLVHSNRQKMPRQFRLEYEDAVYHVMARDNRRESIYRDDRDLLAWLCYLSQACQRTGWRVYGWALMRNHYHLQTRPVTTKQRGAAHVGICRDIARRLLDGLPGMHAHPGGVVTKVLLHVLTQRGLQRTSGPGKCALHAARQRSGLSRLGAEGLEARRCAGVMIHCGGQLIGHAVRFLLVCVRRLADVVFALQSGCFRRLHSAHSPPRSPASRRRTCGEADARRG